MDEYKKFQELALYQAITKGAAGEMAGAAAVDSLRSWFAHLAHADTFRLRVSLWREARPILEEYI